jgi:hypothetical protein
MLVQALTNPDLRGHNLVAAILAAHADVTKAEAKALPHAIACGELLHHAREDVKKSRKGRWIAWLGANLPSIPRRTASLYIQLYEHRTRFTDENGQRVAQNVSIRRAQEIIKQENPGKTGTRKKKKQNQNAFDLYAILQTLSPDEVSTAVNQTWSQEYRRQLIRLLCEAEMPRKQEDAIATLPHIHLIAADEIEQENDND